MNVRLTPIPLAPAPCGKSFAESMLDGLTEAPKGIACKYFYDDRGSRLFDEICEMPEYYHTRTENALLRSYGPEIAALMGENVEIVEFGAGSLRKVRLLLEAAKNICAYTPLDISGEYLGEALSVLAAEFPEVALRPVVADFTLPLSIPVLPSVPRRVGFFPGNTIGNFKPAAAVTLLRRMRGILDGGGLLVGVDLVKDPARLHAAYNDGGGITAAFNKNLLVRANRELGADFDPEAFAHYAPYNLSAQRNEMYLVSLKRQSVTLCGRRFEFAQGESVHTEDSHKYTIEGFQALAAHAGFAPRAVWTDPERLFSVHWLEG